MASRLPRGLPADNPSDPDSVRHILLRTLPGRALVAGGAIRLVASLVQLGTGRSAAIDAVGTVGTLTLLGAIGYFTWRFIARAKRQLLWRVRRKLILSYIFVGLVPVLLAIIFFALCGVLLFMSISSYVVQTRLRSVTEQAATLLIAVKRNPPKPVPFRNRGAPGIPILCRPFRQRQTAPDHNFFLP